MIVILFALMLTRIQDFERLTDNRQWPIAAVAALGVFGLLTAAVLATSSRTRTGEDGEPVRQGVGFEAFGDTLFAQWAVPFEVASLVLLVALIGAVILVRHTGGRD